MKSLNINKITIISILIYIVLTSQSYQTLSSKLLFIPVIMFAISLLISEKIGTQQNADFVFACLIVSSGIFISGLSALHLTNSINSIIGVITILISMYLDNKISTEFSAD